MSVKMIVYCVRVVDGMNCEKPEIVVRYPTHAVALAAAVMYQQDRCNPDDRVVADVSVSPASNLPVQTLSVLTPTGMAVFIVTVKARVKKPTQCSLEEWMRDGIARSLDDCMVEPDGVCAHGCKSWLLVLGLI